MNDILKRIAELKLLPIVVMDKAEHAAEMNRLYSVETNYSLTGGMADHRLRLKPSDIVAFARDLAAH